MSQSSRGSWPAVEADVRRSPRVALAFGSALSTVAAACALFALYTSPVRALLAAAALALAVRPLALLFGLARASVRRFEWAADGGWHIEDRAGTRRAAQLLHGTTVLGSLVLLHWKDRAGRRTYALLDAAATDPRVFCTLRARLRLAGPWNTPRAG